MAYAHNLVFEIGLIKGLFKLFTLRRTLQLNLACYDCNLFLRDYFTLNQTKIPVELINLYYITKTQGNKVRYLRSLGL